MPNAVLSQLDDARFGEEIFAFAAELYLIAQFSCQLTPYPDPWPNSSAADICGGYRPISHPVQGVR